MRGLLTQGEFADRLGIASKTVVRWEQGAAVPDGDSLRALFLLFQADPAWVLTGKGQAPPLTAKESVLLDNYRHAGTAGQKAIESMASALAAGERPPQERSAGFVVHGSIGQASSGDIHNYSPEAKRRPKGK